MKIIVEEDYVNKEYRLVRDGEVIQVIRYTPDDFVYVDTRFDWIIDCPTMDYPHLFNDR
ncbi:MAG TPA: hypothetical protein VJU85_05145 [Nitrososphaeraceae archaeon]|nr:hypothetical protein [Nitrososphaeraceae archaeon]